MTTTGSDFFRIRSKNIYIHIFKKIGSAYAIISHAIYRAGAILFITIIDIKITKKYLIPKTVNKVFYFKIFFKFYLSTNGQFNIANLDLICILKTQSLSIFTSPFRVKALKSYSTSILRRNYHNTHYFFMSSHRRFVSLSDQWKPNWKTYLCKQGYVFYQLGI